MDNNDDQQQQQQPPKSDWAELTEECLTNILSRLSLEDRWRSAMLVCKPWLRVSKDSSLHASLDLEPWFQSPVELAQWWDPEFESRVDSMLNKVVDWNHGVTVIKVRHCSDYALLHAAHRCPNLEILSVKSSPHVTDTSLTRIAFRCIKIRELDISHCYEISHESLVLIGQNCPNLKILKRNFMNWLDPSQYAGVVPSEYLNACPQDGDTEAAAIGKYMSHLEQISQTQSSHDFFQIKTKQRMEHKVQVITRPPTSSSKSRLPCTCNNNHGITSCRHHPRKNLNYASKEIIKRAITPPIKRSKFRCWNFRPTPSRLSNMSKA